jgi:hypothetical protein
VLYRAFPDRIAANSLAIGTYAMTVGDGAFFFSDKTIPLMDDSPGETVRLSPARVKPPRCQLWDHLRQVIPRRNMFHICCPTDDGDGGRASHNADCSACPSSVQSARRHADPHQPRTGSRSRVPSSGAP